MNERQALSIVVFMFVLTQLIKALILMPNENLYHPIDKMSSWQSEFMLFTPEFMARMLNTGEASQ